MADIKQYVNRSNLATFLAKIKELIPSSSSFLTKTEAEETYQGKLKYYTEGTQDAAISISYNGGASVVGGSTGGFAIDENAVGIVSAGLPIEAGAFGSDISFATTGNGDIKMTNNPDADGNKGKAYYNNSEILSEASVVDSLDSASTTNPLSANQGRVLNEKISDILPKSDVMTNTDVAMLSRVFALPLSSYVGAGLYQPSTDTIGKYTEMFNSLADGELVVCEYQGVKGLYKYQGGTQLYCFSQWAADLTKIPTGVEDSLTSSSTGEALSANQGMVLNGKIADLQSDVSSLENQFTNQVWIMKNTTTNPISRSLLYPQAGNPAVGDVILGIDYYGDHPVTPLRLTRINGDDIAYTIITEIVSS